MQHSSSDKARRLQKLLQPQLLAYAGEQRRLLLRIMAAITALLT
jgi:hypothetical protein